MSTEQVGAYILLLCKSWREKPPGSLPSDDSLLAKWARVSLDRWSEIRSGVLAPYTFGTDSRWHQKRQRAEYDKLMSRRRECSKAGKASVKKRLSTTVKRPLNIPFASSSSIQDLNPAATPAAVPTKRSKTPEEQKQNIDARDHRVAQEIETLRESTVGSGPGSEQQVQHTIDRIARKMEVWRPLSEAEYSRRREDQKRRLEDHLRSKAVPS